MDHGKRSTRFLFNFIARESRLPNDGIISYYLLQEGVTSQFTFISHFELFSKSCIVLCHESSFNSLSDSGGTVTLFAHYAA